MLVIEGVVKNYKRTYRIYCEEGLQVRTKKRKKIVRLRVPMLVPNAVNERWSMDFVSDQIANGRRFRVLNMVDDFSRELVLQIVDFSISGQRVANELSRMIRQLPRTIVCDNGPCTSFSPESRLRTRSSRASTESSESTVSTCTGSPAFRTPGQRSKTGERITT